MLEIGGPVAMPWLEKVPAVLAAFYPGAGGGEAIAGVLFGRVNPSGHLPVTFPSDEAQLPLPVQSDPAATTSNPGLPLRGGVLHLNYDIEGSDVGYRWFKRHGLKPLFPFGHGLSFTRFALDDFSARLVHGRVIAEFAITNTGARAGADVPQLYVSREGPGGFIQRLAGFARVEVRPGETERVELEIDLRLLAHYDVNGGEWVFAGAPLNFGPQGVSRGGESLGDKDELAGRVQLLVEPSDSFRMRLPVDAVEIAVEAARALAEATELVGDIARERAAQPVMSSQRPSGGSGATTGE